METSTIMMFERHQLKHCLKTPLLMSRMQQTVNTTRVENHHQTREYPPLT